MEFEELLSKSTEYRSVGVRVSLVAKAHSESVDGGQRICRSIRTRKIVDYPFDRP